MTWGTARAFVVIVARSRNNAASTGLRFCRGDVCGAVIPRYTTQPVVQHALDEDLHDEYEEHALDVDLHGGQGGHKEQLRGA